MSNINVPININTIGTGSHQDPEGGNPNPKGGANNGNNDNNGGDPPNPSDPNNPPNPPNPDGGDGGAGGNGGAGGAGNDVTIKLPTPDENGNINLFEDADGNLVDKDNNIVVTKDKVTRDESGNVVPPSIEEDPIIDLVRTGVESKLGISLKDSEGNPLTFNDDTDGIVELVVAGIKKGVLEEQAAMEAQLPAMKHFRNHLMAGKDPASYFALGSRWKNATLPDSNQTDAASNALRKQYVAEYKKAAYGFDEAPADEQALLEAKINKEIQRIEDANELTAESEFSLKKLKKIEEDAIKARDAENDTLINNRKIENRKKWNTITEIVKSGDLKGLNIPANERSGFLAYIGEPVDKNGATQEMLDTAQEPLEYKLQLALMRYLKFDLNHLVKLTAASEKAASLSQRKRVKFVLGNSSGSSGMGANTGATGGNAPKITLNKIAN